MTSSDFAAQNRAQLIEYFHGGEKGSGNTSLLGVEVEHFVLADDGNPISYEPVDGRIGVREVLSQLEMDYPQATYNERNDLLGLAGDDGSVTLEPAAQLEISIAPYAHVHDVERAYRHFRSLADSILAKRDAHLEAHGYHTTRCAKDLTLIPKRRYDFMDAYFAHIKSDGDRMMRASSSTQVSIDFASEADAVRKMRVASALSPILAAIADNTQVFEFEENHIPIRRLQLWREVDNLRCGTIPGIFDDGFGFGTYADWLLRTPPIFVTRPAADDPEGERLRPFFDTAASEVYADAPMSRDDVEHVTSMFWPDVRLKLFVEIRPADSLPEKCILGYTALIKGLFYSDESLGAIEEALGVSPEAASTRSAWPLSKGCVDEGIAQIQTHGLGGLVYGKELRDWEALLFSLARTALPVEERHYLDALEAFAQEKPWWWVEPRPS
ncbi:MAG: hypothetical protein J6D34_02370 [Atopobiaceae bacterium]|nr:hypothetical protein [Atopobiaceae bacterium]